MRTLLIAFGLICAAIAAAFACLVMVGMEEKGAAQLAAALLAGIPYLKSTLDKNAEQKAQGAPVIRPFAGYVINPGLATAYAACMVLGVMLFASGVGGLVAMGHASSMQETLQIAALVAFVIVAPAVFFIGRWIGRRVTRLGIPVIIAAAIVARTLATYIDYQVLPHDVNNAITPFDVASAYGPLLNILTGSLVLGGIALVGYWRGTRQRLSCYLAYLLRAVPPQTRDAIVDLAYDEARTHAATSVPATAAIPSPAHP